jgi:hypothetical protein
MLIYNVTTGVEKKFEQEWVAWMREVHIPDVMKTKMFMSYRMYRILAADEGDSVSYAVQYQAQSINQIERYLEDFAPALRDEAKKRFGEKATSFRTLLEEVT